MQKMEGHHKRSLFGEKSRTSGNSYDKRIQIFFIILCTLFLVVALRLFSLMIVNGEFYKKLAAGAQEFYAELLPKRGEIFTQDSRTGEKFPLALNKESYLLFADTRLIKTEDDAKKVLDALTDMFHYEGNRTSTVWASLNKRTDPYEPIEKKVEQEQMEKIKAMKLPGIAFVKIPTRFYPEGNLAASVIGFVSNNDQNREIGKYGIESYFQKELSGKEGELTGTTAHGGGWIPFDTRIFRSSDADDGADLTLTIDRTIEFQACERLYQGMLEYNASSASLVIMDPYTGAIRAMCSYPDFDPNKYGEVQDIRSYNNSTIFTPYEPGSIFKAIAMAALLNEGLVDPHSPFHDPGVRADLCKTPIRNAENKSYNDTDMTGILEDSINTGMIYIAERLGTNRFRDYVEKFGFGVKSGIELDTETPGNIESLNKNKNTKKIDCYTATASFGQGLTVTPLQMAAAYSAIANGGILMSPYIVDEMTLSNGKVIKTQAKEVRRVISTHAASMLSGMLVNVVENGHAQAAKSKEYYIAGKTGTAQIPGPGGYTADTIHSFVGFAPVDHPKFVMIVKYEKPERKYAESTAVPVFSDISNFLLQYYQVMPGRK